MKQRITLEIDNDTGIEFEEVAEYRRVEVGEYWVNDAILYGPAIEGTEYYGSRHVLTPKVDKELEEAKKLIGTLVYLGSNKKHLYQIDDVERDANNILIAWINESWITCSICTPFPIPTWRCCENEKPKKDGDYFTRAVDTKGWMGTNYFKNGRWTKECRDEEWLDEGESENYTWRQEPGEVLMQGGE